MFQKECFRKNIKTNHDKIRDDEMIRLEMKNCNMILTEKQKNISIIIWKKR